MNRDGVEFIYTEKAPRPVGPYSQAVRSGCLLFIAGQIPLDPNSGKLVADDFEKASIRALDNLKAIVEAAGGSLDNIVKVTVYIRDISKFSQFNKIYAEYFKHVKPARAVVEVSNLPLDAPLEIEAIAYLC